MAVAAGALLAGCGGTVAGGGRAPNPSVTTTPTPAPADILLQPARSSMKDMHFTAVIRVTSGGQTAQLTGEGDMVVRPASAFRLQVQGVVAGSSLSEDIITAGGTDDVRQGTRKYMASPSTQGSDVNTWHEATDATLVGMEELPAGRAWHVKALSRLGNPFEAWIRTGDGYLLQYAATSKSGSTSFAYSMVRFNTGVAIQAPPPNEVG